MNKLLKSIVAASVGFAMAIGAGVGFGREARATYASSFEWELVTSAPSDWSGEYILCSGSSGTVKMMKGSDFTLGATSINGQDVTVSSGKISADDSDAIVIEKSSTSGKYSVKINGIYVGKNANSNGIDSSETMGTNYNNAISYSSGKTLIAGNGGRALTWYASSGYFRYFASSNNCTQLFKKISGDAPTTYAVKYDANGGTGTTIDSTAYEEDDTATALPNGFVRIGYEFDHWNTKADNTGVSYNPGAQFSIGSDVTLYAQWNVDSDGLGTENNPFTVEEARNAIDEYETVENAHVQGMISSVDSYNSKYSSISYHISDDGKTTSDQLLVYSGKGLDEADFSSIEDIKVAASVVVTGNLKKHDSDYEFDYNNYLVSYVESQRKLVSIAVSGQEIEFNVGDSFVFGGVVTATYDDASTTEISSGYEISGYNMNNAGTQTVTVSYEEGSVTAETTYTITVSEAAASDFVQVNSFTNGKKYLIAANGSSNANKKYYLPAATAAIGSNPAAEEIVSLADLTEDDAWTASVDSESHIVFYNDYEGTTYYLTATNTAQGIHVTTSANDGYWVFDNTGLRYNDGGTRYMATYNDSSFRYYTAPLNSGQSMANVFYEFVQDVDDPESFLSSAKTYATIHARESGISTDSCTLANMGFSDAQEISGFDIGNNISVTCDAGSSSNSPKYYNSGSSLRLYKQNIITFSNNSSAICRIEFKLSDGKLSYLSPSVGEINTSGWEGEANSITFTNSGTDQVRISEIKVTCAEGTYSVSNVAIRFGASISQVDWNTIKNHEGWTIQDYGVMMLKKVTLQGYGKSSVGQAYKDGKAVSIVNKTKNGASYADPYESGNIYSFTAKLSFTNAADYDEVVVAAPFVKINNEYHFLNEVEFSVNSLAAYYLNNPTYMGGASLSNKGLTYLSTAH